MDKSRCKILFYTGNHYVFRAGPIGYLYEIARLYPVILLTEQLDDETKKIIKNRVLFPNLESVIPVNQTTGEKISLWKKNRRLHQLAKEIVEKYKPGIIMTANDLDLLNLYLMRFAGKLNTVNVVFQPANIPDSRTFSRWVTLINAYLKLPSYFPRWLRISLIKTRNHLGHFIYYWILPLSVGELPFIGKSSLILRTGTTGMRAADYQLVFTERDYKTYLKEGVPSKKLYILPHPLSGTARSFFERAFLPASSNSKKGQKIAVLMLPEVKIGFRKADSSLIPNDEKMNDWIKTITLINQVLKGWKIYIKPHPDIKSIKTIKLAAEAISKNIEVVDPQEPADKYIRLADIIIGLPVSASTVLFTASLQCPEKPLISLDFYQEILGDYYKDFPGIDYVTSKTELEEKLKLIASGKYEKSGTKLTEEGFKNTIELIHYVTDQNPSHSRSSLT